MHRARLLGIGLFLAYATCASAVAQTPTRVVLLHQKPDGHPRATHEYLPGQTILAGLLRKNGAEATLVAADEPWRDGPEAIAKADAIVVFVSEGAKWLHADPKRTAAFRERAAQGVGLSVIHWGMGTKDEKNVAGFVALFGGCHGGPGRKYQVTQTKVTPTKHPVTTGLGAFGLRDEFYYRLHLAQGAEPLVRADIDGQPETVGWAWGRPGGGRSFGFSGLHFHESWASDEVRRLVVQGVLWTARQPIPSTGANVRIDAAALALPEKK